MIHLYRLGNENYDKNGDVILSPVSCETDSTLNGDWTGTLVHPLDPEGKWKELQDDVVVKLPFMDGSDQLYQVVDHEVDDSKNRITCQLEHIFYQSIDDCWIDDKRPTNCNGQQALNSMITNPRYSGSSNISRTATAYYQDRNLMDAINGDDENSFLNRWGGEIYFNNFKITINDRVGADRGVEIRYGKNMNGMTMNVDYRDVVTRIKPKAYNGYTMTDDGCIDSPNINKYRTIKKKAMSFENVKMREDASDSDEEDGAIICDTQAQLDAALKEQCEQQYASGLDSPSVSGSINLVLLQNAEEYEDVKDLETVCLGDTVHCINRKIDVSSEARVVNLVWDAIRKKVVSVEIGELEFNFFDRASSTSRAIESVIDVKTKSVIAETIRGVINASDAMMKAQKTVAQKADVRALLFEDSDPDSPTFGAMCLGTQGLQISHERSPDGSDWVWGTAINYNSIIADYIITGILSDKTGNFYLNLDTGELVMNDGTFKGELETEKDVGVGNWLYLGTQQTDGTFSASGVTVGALGTGNINKPLLNMWGNINQKAGSILIKSCNESSKAAEVYVSSSEQDNDSYIQLTCEKLTINGQTGLTGEYDNNIVGIKVQNGIVRGVTHGGGLTGTYTVDNSITVKNGRVTGVD